MFIHNIGKATHKVSILQGEGEVQVEKKKVKEHGRNLNGTGFYGREVYHGSFMQNLHTVRANLSGTDTTRIETSR